MISHLICFLVLHVIVALRTIFAVLLCYGSCYTYECFELYYRQRIDAFLMP